ncbi:MAG: hypothetical protein SGJ18_11725 [Pseudomonadota bacterium]|nr:hypothetical protein [Pseudomonadota bacterium]
MTDQEKAEVKAVRAELHRVASEKYVEEFSVLVKGIWPPNLIFLLGGVGSNETASVTLKNGLTFKFDKIYHPLSKHWIEIGFEGDDGDVEIMVSEICVVEIRDKP